MEPLPETAAAPTPPLPADRARQLLRRLRDLNLSTGRIALDGAHGVRFAGCLSADLPAEESLLYRVEVDGGSEGQLAIRWSSGWLNLDLQSRNGHTLSRHLSTPLVLDGEGRASAPELGARIQPDTNDLRELEHFLRRLIRGLLAPAA